MELEDSFWLAKMVDALRVLVLALLLLPSQAVLPAWHSPNYYCKDAQAPWPQCVDPQKLRDQGVHVTPTHTEAHNFIVIMYVRHC